MPRTRFARVVTTVAFGATIAFTVATPAWSAARATAHQQPGTPAGGNGTVKLDGLDTDATPGNEPQVTCGFAVEFANFDEGERVNIVFTAQAPTRADVPLLRRDNVLIGRDAAGGARPDPDEVLRFSAGDLDLSAVTPHPQQGYHVKLSVERIGAPAAGRHKVFWLRPCTGQAPPAGHTPDDTAQRCGTCAPTDVTRDTTTDVTTDVTTDGTAETPDTTATTGTSAPASALKDASLASTGTAINGIVLLGLGLTAAGTALLTVRRRHTRFTDSDVT